MCFLLLNKIKKTHNNNHIGRKISKTHQRLMCRRGPDLNSIKM